jgi:HEAT repeat protein
MNSEEQPHNLATIRKLLLDTFRDGQDLRRFCQDRPTFQPILPLFGPGFSLADMIDAVLDYCERRLLLDDLQAEIKTYVPPQSPSKDREDELRAFIAKAFSDYELRMERLVSRPLGTPDSPYKFLYPFEIEDAGIFFGRDAATKALYNTVLADRLTVLHAKSGAGKTSLLKAGLSPRLIREGYLPVYARAYDDLVRAIKLALAPPSLGPWPELLSQLTLQEFLGLVCKELSRDIRGLVIILDQFEEFFVFWPERDHRQPVIDALGDCYDDKTLPIHLVIVIRGDYFANLADFDKRIPTVFHNQYRLESMTREEAEAAISGPVAQLDGEVSYEPALLKTLLDDLARGGIQLPHLQIICTRLYEGLAKAETKITLDSYEALGKAQGVLGRYLQEVLDQLPGRGAKIAKAVLVELVSSEATKRVLSYEVLAARVEAEKAELEDVLTRLVNARLLRRDETRGGIAYELAHEYLIGAISEELGQADWDLKQAEELLAREVASWRVHGTLIPEDRLWLLSEYREQLRGLDDEEWECILRSALRADSSLEDWVRLAGVAGLKPLIFAWRYEDEAIQRKAASALREVGDRQAVEPFIAALGDGDLDVRMGAAWVLGKIGDGRATEPLIASLGDQETEVRWIAASALGEIGDTRAIEPLIAALEDDYSEVGIESARALARFDEPAIEALMAALGDDYSTVSSGVARALGMIGDTRAIEPLIAALGNEDSGVRWMAASALGEIGDTQAVEPLITALSDKIGSVRGAAAKALTSIGTPEALAALKKAGL